MAPTVRIGPCDVNPVFASPHPPIRGYRPASHRSTFGLWGCCRSSLLVTNCSPLRRDLTGTELTGTRACEIVARAVNRVAPYDAGALMTTDPETHLPAGGVVSGFEASACAPFWDNELLDPDFNKFNDLAKRVEPLATLVEATDGEIDRSPRYVKLYADFGASDELRVAFMAGATCLAIGAFVRCGGTFSATETSDVRHLLVPAVEVLRRGLVGAEHAVGHGPVVVLLDGHHRIVSKSDGADDVLDDLRVSVDGDVPSTILVAVSSAVAGRSSARLTTRLRGRSGRWVRLHVAPMDGPGELLAVTIDRATPSDLVPILLDSHGYTAREAEIVLALCRGLATKEIAVELGISAHTVRDHLKVVFTKTGVNTRGELVARLFADHVIDHFEERVITLTPG